MTQRETSGFPSIPPVLVGLPDWYELLIIDDNGHARAIAKNAETALENDPAFAGAIRLDEFRGQTMVAAPLPWDPNWWGPRPWEDIDDTRAMLWLQDHEILVGSTVVHEIVNAIAKAHAYHSVIDYFGDLGWTSTSPTTSIWDGTSRVGGGNDVSWLTRYLGVPDSPMSVPSVLAGPSLASTASSIPAARPLFWCLGTRPGSISPPCLRF